MNEVVAVALIAAVPSGIAALLTYLATRSRQPREDAKSDVDWQQESVKAWAAINTLVAQLSETNIKQSLALAAAADLGTKQAAAISLLTETNTQQLLKIDGLPKQIAEQVAQKLVDDAYILALQDALYKVGLTRQEQPQQQPALPITPLTPEGQKLMTQAALPPPENLAQEKADTLHVGDTVTLDQDNLIEKPTDSKNKE